MIRGSLAARLAPLSLLAVTALPAAALAAEEYARRRINWFDFSNPDTPPMIAAIINFLLFMGVLYLVLRKPIGNMTRNRREEHVSAAGEARRQMAEAELALAAARARSESLDLEIARLRQEFHEAGKAEIARIAAETEAQAGRMRADAEARIAGELERLSEELRAEAVAVVVARAEGFLRAEIQSADHERLSADIVEGLLAEFQAAARDLRALADRRAGRLRADVISAGPLSEAATERIRGALQQIAGKPVAVTRHEEPALIGGMTARIGDLVVDGSLRTRLARIREEMLERA